MRRTVAASTDMPRAYSRAAFAAATSTAVLRTGREKPI
jgi:hypothetical protein